MVLMWALVFMCSSHVHGESVVAHMCIGHVRGSGCACGCGQGSCVPGECAALLHESG